MAARNAAASAAAVGSTSQPAPSVAASLHGEPVVVITGVPAASASPTTSPKFSLNDGSTNTSAAAYHRHLSASAISPGNSTCRLTPSSATTRSTSTRCPPSSGPAITSRHSTGGAA